MFEALRSTRVVSKAEFSREERNLRGKLIEAQFGLLESSDFPVVVLLSGVNAPGRSATAKQLMSWMDPRFIRHYAPLPPAGEQLMRPRMWRFWQALPGKGRIGIFLDAWYEDPVRDRFVGSSGNGTYHHYIEEILHFEEMLSGHGFLFLKFMFAMPKDEHVNLLKKIKREPGSAWKISKDEIEIERAFSRRYTDSLTIFEDLVSHTSSAHSPWIPLSSANRRYRDLTIGRALISAIEDRQNNKNGRIRASATRAAMDLPSINILDDLDLSQSLSASKYRKKLDKQQARLTELTLSKRFEDVALVAVFEGNDAAGKGGSIRRVFHALDPRMARTISIAAPTDEEQEHHYLWRFWRHIPRKGNVAIFDRSWYGRVLVERIEGYCSEADWIYAYDEIKRFERELIRYGVIVVKFWLAIDQEEQLRRFQDREKTGYKRHKITDEDWRNREKWDDYKAAVHDMVLNTSINEAPWTLVEANDKRFARIKVLKTVNQRLRVALNGG
ncbi:MAG: polyphosphate:AMP phosphotransferase [Pseudomonadota bacterium]